MDTTQRFIAPLDGRIAKLTVLFLLVAIFAGYALRTLAPYNFEIVVSFALPALLFLWVRNKGLVYSKSLLAFIGLLILFYVAVYLNSHLFHELGENGLGELKILTLFVGFAAFTLFLFQFRLTIDTFWWFFILASLVMLFLFYLEFQQIGFEGIERGRRFGRTYSHPISFGLYSNALLVIMLGGFVWAYKKGPFFFVLWSVLVLSHLAMVVLSQTRTAWIGWPEAIVGWGGFYLYLILRSSVSGKVKLFAVAAPVILLVQLVLLEPVNNIFESRYQQAKTDVTLYLEGANPFTSIGQRFVMYEATANMIAKQPWTGFGPEEFQSQFRMHVQEILINKFDRKRYLLKDHTHAHNQFLMTWIQYGVFAVLLLASIFIFLIGYFLSQMKSARDEEKPIFIAGLVFTIASLLAFMPESPLEIARYTGHYLLFFSVLFVFAQAASRGDSVEVSNR